MKGDGLGVVEAGDGGVGHDAHALVDGFRWVVEDGVEIGGVRQPEPGDALVRAVDDEVGSVWESGDTWHYALGGHALDGPV